jgi:hypothetical protein
MWRSPLCFAVAVLATWCCATPAPAQITLDGGEAQVTMSTAMSAFRSFMPERKRPAAAKARPVAQLDRLQGRANLRDLGNLVVHEWSHNYGWRHGQGHGVPGDPGPDTSH